MKIATHVLKSNFIALLIPAAFLVLLVQTSLAQNKNGILKGHIIDEQKHIIAGATAVLTGTYYATLSNKQGTYEFKGLPTGTYELVVSKTGFKSLISTVVVTPDKSVTIDVTLLFTTKQLEEVVVRGYRAITGMGYLKDVHDGIIYSGKKTEVILLDSINANTAQNNPRQILGRIPGANYSETEGSGFPSNGIGFRGLNPKQSVETNTRQNGYNVTADIYGYPEAYYLPPLEAIERIEVTRGAASLQFGPQFGGVINYITKQGPKDNPLEVNIQQTGGSFGLFNSFTSAGGTIGKFNYYSFLQYKNVQGWRPNSQFQQLSGFAGVNYQANEKLKIGLEYSILRNRIQMPGGFNDAQFNLDSRASYRARNWLNSPWNIITGKVDYLFSANTKLSIKSAYQFSQRNLVWKNEDGGPGEPDSISTITLQPVNREVQRENFNSTTTEARLSSNYRIGGLYSTLATGVRYSYGTLKRQGGGLGTTGSDFDLTLLNPHYEYSLDFTTTNIAPYAENLFHITDRLSVTPGLRLEYLNTKAKGYVNQDNEEMQTDKVKNRLFLLFGAGAQYQISPTTNIYANISQAYRPVTYDQLTPFGSSSKIDPNMKDASGYNADLGWRGSIKNYLNFDISGFYLRYNNRIGLIEQTDAGGNPYILRTNVANSLHRGAETYIELNLTRAFFPGMHFGTFSFYNSFSFIDARYISGQFKGKQVEYAPRAINRFGLTYAYKVFSTTFLISHTAQSYGDATNTISSDDPVAGLIPAYRVLDWSGTLHLKRYQFRLGINNLADKRYFTSRTDEYPGPGIIPAIGRSLYVGFGVHF